MEKELEFVKNSQYRIKVIKTLEGNVKMPNEIATDAGIEKKIISNIIKQLREQDILVCINPEVRKGRLYRLTDLGNEIAKKL
ncbi:transcriptional regulator [uncultured Methanobrevibacter sp.]|uniref:transcriptional regulator n=1 Tax=uncultured Methanobrevibacter sp. TaxID=253161 RepID=UPI0025F6A832|nr:transcriptional regulator [uncultured Methanobrevibacter sp.]